MLRIAANFLGIRAPFIQREKKYDFEIDLGVTEKIQNACKNFYAQPLSMESCPLDLITAEDVEAIRGKKKELKKIDATNFRLKNETHKANPQYNDLSAVRKIHLRVVNLFFFNQHPQRDLLLIFAYNHHLNATKNDELMIQKIKVTSLKV